MAQIKEKIFLHHISQTINSVRNELIAKHTPKKGGRFMTEGITYEIGDAMFDDNLYKFEISSKIPNDYTTSVKEKELYFNEVVRLARAVGTSPCDEKMESIVRSKDEELKERNYVSLTYGYLEEELYNVDSIRIQLENYKNEGKPVPNIPGITTDMGRMVIVSIVENFRYMLVDRIENLIRANQEVIAGLVRLKKSPHSSR